MGAAVGTTAWRSVGLTRLSPRRWLVIVGVAYAAIQLLAFDADRAASWDEAIYLSQVAPGAEAYVFTASRARGITILVAPAAATGSMPVIRVSLALLSSTALAAAFLPWVRVVGAAAPVGAAFFASGWTALFYGSEVMPNLWLALVGVAAFGLVTRRGAGGSSRDDPAAAALLVVAGLIRPFDAVLLAAPLLVAAVVVGRRPLRRAALLGASVVVGCVPWLVEMAVRYRGVGAAVGQAVAMGHVSVPDPVARIVQYLATADGPTIGPVADPGVPVAGVLVVVAPAALAAVGVVAARRRAAFGPIVAALAGALFLAAAYVAFIGGVAPRFLLPAHALVSVPVGWSLVVAWRAAGLPVARVALVSALLAWLVWQASLAVGLESAAARQRAALREIGSRIGAVADRRDCVVDSVVGAPQVAYASGCRGRWITDARAVDAALEREAGRGVDVVFFVLREPLGTEPAGTADRWTASDRSTGRLWLYAVDVPPGQRPIAA